MRGMEAIKYVSENGYKGILYDSHADAFGDQCYQMSICKRDDGHEVLHAFDATPKTLAQLKDIVESMPEFLEGLKEITI